jgi:hypothetical protein
LLAGATVRSTGAGFVAPFASLVVVLLVVIVLAPSGVASLPVVLLVASLHPIARALGCRFVCVETKQRPTQWQCRQHGDEPAAGAAASEGAGKGIKADRIHSASDDMEPHSTHVRRGSVSTALPLRIAAYHGAVAG